MKVINTNNNYINFLTSLLLLKITKRQVSLLVALYLNYLHFLGNPVKGIKLKDLAADTGLPSNLISEDLECLINHMAIGAFIYVESFGQRKIISHFNDEFKKTLKGPNFEKEAISRAGFYIINGKKIYVFNPIVKNWKYASYSYIGRTLKSLLKRFKTNDFLIQLLKLKQIVKSKDGVKDDGEVTSKDLVAQFSVAFSAFYSSHYGINWKMDCINLKKVKDLFERNNRKLSGFSKFLDWSFKKAKKRNIILNTSLLKYYVNDYMAMPENKESIFVTDFQGNKMLKTEYEKQKEEKSG